MDESLQEQIELYILTNYQDYSKEVLVNELIKSGLSRDDANQIYKSTIKKMLKPSQKMHHTNSSIVPYLLLIILFVCIVSLIFLF